MGTTTHKRVLHIGEGRGTKSTGYPKVDRKDKWIYIRSEEKLVERERESNPYHGFMERQKRQQN